MNTIDISAEPKTALNLLAHVLKEIEHARDRLGIIITARCTDAGGDCAKMRRELVKALPWIVSLDCWCHQVSDSVATTGCATHSMRRSTSLSATC